MQTYGSAYTVRQPSLDHTLHTPIAARAALPAIAKATANRAQPGINRATARRCTAGPRAQPAPARQSEPGGGHRLLGGGLGGGEPHALPLDLRCDVLADDD